MIEVDLRQSLRSVRAEFRALQAGPIARATVRALNKTATSVRARVGPIIRERYHVRSGTVRRRLRIERASRASKVAAIVAMDRPIALTSFRVTWRRRLPGARVQVQRSGAAHAIPGSFIARTQAGRRGLFKRAGRQRYPLVFQTSDQVPAAQMPAMFLDEQVAAANRATARERYARVLEQELRYELVRRSRSA